MVFSWGTWKGDRVVDRPLTSTRLNRFAPTMLPRDRALWPFTREVMAVTSSGREVPRATKVRAMTDSGTPSPWAMRVPLFTSRLAPTAMKAAPMTSSRMSLPMEGVPSMASSAPPACTVSRKLWRTVRTMYTANITSSTMPASRVKAPLV